MMMHHLTHPPTHIRIHTYTRPHTYTCMLNTSTSTYYVCTSRECLILGRRMHILAYGVTAYGIN